MTVTVTVDQATCNGSVVETDQGQTVSGSITEPALVAVEFNGKTNGVTGVGRRSEPQLPWTVHQWSLHVSTSGRE